MKIGLIYVLRRGDQRVKALIEEIMYLRRMDLNSISISYNEDTEKPPNITMGDIRSQGESVDLWLLFRAIQFAIFNPNIDRPLEDTFNLKNPTEFDLGDKRVKLRSFSIRFTPCEIVFSGCPT